MVKLQHGAFGRESLIRQLELLTSYDIDRVAPLQPEMLDIIIHFLFDDTRIADNTEGVIGIILVDAEEARAITALLEALQHLMDEFDLDDPQSYPGSTEWKHVLTTAQIALNMLKKNG